MRGRVGARFGAGLVAWASAAVLGAQPAAGIGVGSLAGDGPPASLLRQSVTWQRCQTSSADVEGAELDDAGAQCAEVTMPLDYNRPGGPTVKVALSRLKATGPGERRGVLFYNPGGPGVPAMYLALKFRQAEPTVGAHYDVIGMDPRFVGRSTPLDCQWPLPGPGAAGPDRAGFERSAALSRDLASNCARHREVLPHASTRNTARDMDTVRALLGERRLSYVGSSYGSYLGQVYLQMFPRRVDRAVLDSALDPDRFGPDLTNTQGPAMAAAMENWAVWAARRHDRYRLGATAADVLASVRGIGSTVNRGPLRVGGHQVDSRTLPQVLWSVSAGDDETTYGDFAAVVRVLADAARGLDVSPTPLLEAVLTGLNSPDVGGTAAAQTAILCADREASRDTETYYRAIQTRRGDEPVFGSLIYNLTPCSFWPAAPAEPPTRVRNDVPVLMVGADGDPAATYEGQLHAHRALAGSRLVMLRGAFHHTVCAGLFAPRNTCVDLAVNRYLIDGILPSRDTSCLNS